VMLQLSLLIVCLNACSEDDGNGGKSGDGDAESATDGDMDTEPDSSA